MKPQELIEELTSFEYPAQADLADEADMVMKGGITSGIVYPLAVCEMAKTRRFKNLGGSSAGGIAAAMAAAAEVGRDRRGFNELAALPDELGRDLLAMFQPSRATRPLFRILLATMDKQRGVVRRGLKVAAGVVATAPGVFFASLLGGLALGAFGLLVTAGAPQRGADWARLAVGMAVMVLPALGLACVAALVAAGLSARRRLDGNGFGLCIGSAGPQWPASAPAGQVEPFTDWLHVRLNTAAGRESVRTHVLTFGELWGAEAATATRPDHCNVRLEMMTTNVTFGRPMRLPFEQNVYSYCPDELARYFPPPVMEHLRRHARPASEDDAAEWTCPEHEGQALVRLPVAGDLPVIVAVRMTLSFPGLISAVPLYAIDYGAATPGPLRCWFSDGGVSSNFPIHFFDSLWPARPTFGISLGPYPADRPPTDAYFRGKGKAAALRARPTASLPAFCASLLDTLQNWSDEGQATLPGYRDRIVEVRTSGTEGGINLNMTRETILSMCARGHAAAVALQQFDFPAHRDVRYRTAMGQLDRTVRDLRSKYDGTLPGGSPGYRQFVLDSPFPRANAQWRRQAADRTDQLLTFVGVPAGEEAAGAAVPPPDFTKVGTEPRPIPDLRIVAHF